MNNNTVVLTTLLNGEQSKKEMEALRVKAKTLAMSIDDAAKKMNYALAGQLKKELTETNKEITKLKRQTIDVNHVLKNLSTAKPRELQQAFSALNKQLDNGSVRRGSKEWDVLNDKLKLIRREMQKIKAESSVSESFVSRLANGFNKYFTGALTLVASLTGISMQLRRTAEDVAKMDDKYADVSKTTGLTRDEVVFLNEEFKKMDTRTAREQLNDLARDAGKLGISAKEDVMQFVEAGNQINVALGEDLGEGAIRNIGKITEVFKLSTKELEGMDLKGRMLAVGSAINELGQSSTANEAYLVNFTQRLGGVASQAGISVQDILGYASALDQSGQAVEMSATALQKFIMKVMGEPAKFAKIAGIEVGKFNRLLKTDTNEAVKTVLKSLSEKGGFQQLIPIFEDMGLDGARAVGVLSSLATNIKLVDEAQRISNESFAAGTGVTKEYNVKNNNLMAQLEKRRKAFKDAALELGEQLNPALLVSTNYMTYLVRLLPGLLDVLFKYGKYVLYLATAYAVYTAAMKVSMAWEAKNKVAFTLSNLILKTKIALLDAAKTATLAYNVVLGLLTGNIVRMRAAWKLLTVSMGTNPIGLIAVAATAAIAGIIKLVQWLNRTSEATRAVKEATEQFNGELASEQREVRQLFEAYRKSNPATETHKLLRDKIIKQYGPYLKGLINEKGEITNIGEAINRVNNHLREQIALKIKNAATDKIMEDSLNDQAKIVDKIMKKIGKQVSGEEMLSAIRESINKTVSEFTLQGSKDYAALERQILADLQHTYDIDAYKGVFNVKNAVGDLIDEVKSSGDAVDEVNKKFSGMITNMTNVDSVIKTDGGTGSGDDIVVPPNSVSKSKSKDDPLKKREEQLKKSYDRQLLDLKKSLLDKRVTEEEFQRLSYQAEISYLSSILEARKQLKADTTDVETQITDKMISEANRRYQLAKDLQQEFEKEIKDRPREEAIAEDYSPQNFNDEKMILDLKHEYGMISEEEYQKSIYDLREEYLDKYLSKYMAVAEGIRNISSDLSGAVDNFQRAEEMSVERKYDKLIKAAGNNKNKVAKLEEEKEKKLHAVRAKYADKQFIITVASVIANTATAAMESYKAMAGIPVIGPALGAAAAAAAVLFGAGQIAVAKQQRDVAKEGYSGGGYTKKGNWWEEDGRVHKGEFVGNRFALANPTVRKVFDVVDRAQRTNTVGSLTDRDFTTALDYNEHTQRRVMSDIMSGFNPIQERQDYSGAVVDALNRNADVNRKLSERLDDPIVAETYIEGKGGSKEANELYNKMKKNISRS